LALVATVVLLGSSGAFAQQQQRGLCARVKIQIEQELTLERIGFLATLEITNNEGVDLTDFSAALTFSNPELGTADEPNDASNLFFVQPPELTGITSVDGGGILPPQGHAVITWFIIPKIAAGGEDPLGIRYLCGVNLAGKVNGTEIQPDLLQVIPDWITVRPEPQLEITYFQPRDVKGDDPFTVDIVESPIPFTLGVLVRNVGFGPAKKVQIVSKQPRIVENRQGLLLIAQLLGSRVDDEPTDEASLTVNLGDIDPSRCRKGAWDMITSLDGEFVEFSASYTHASELGGQETSVIVSLDAFFLAHEVLNDQPGRDGLLDFLADTDNDGERIPDALYETDCNVLPVNHLLDVSVMGDANGAVVRAVADREDWVYMRVFDPGQAKFDIARVVRSDGKVLNPNNYWTNIRYARENNQRLAYLNIFDFVTLGDYEYHVEYTGLVPDEDPPVTKLRFAGPVEEAEDGKFYILPHTQMYFTVEDASPVGTFYKLDDEEFRPAYPFSIDEPGEHVLIYYSRDSSGNTEPERVATLLVPGDFPGVGELTIDVPEIFSSGDTLSFRPSQASIRFEGVPTSSRLDAELEIFRGVIGYPTVAGVPSSPTRASSATIQVSGENVDFYRYRLGEAVWSEEFSVAEPIVFTDLTDGLYELQVNGRSQYSSYLADEDAVSVVWEVDSSAPPIVITGTPETPTTNADATLSVSGVDLYRYRPDEGFYRAEMPIAQPVELTRLEDGEHVVDFIGKTGAGPWQEEANATRVAWTVDRGYGFDLSTLERVRHERYLDIGSDAQTFVWDGRDDDGVFASAGVYTVLLTVRDELGRETKASALVRIGDLAENAMPLAASPGTQKGLHAYGRFVVWQDQRDGSWDIFARDLFGANGSEIAVTSDSLNQEAPYTDGKFVVWESRRVDGGWDIRGKDLQLGEDSFSVTDTADTDERNPAVFWPWIVFQARPAGIETAPWQLVAFDMRDSSSRVFDPTTQDQRDPAIHKNRVVWRDFRDPGAGEIYAHDLVRDVSVRLTENLHGQFDPSVYEDWVVWSDSRNGQNDLYGFHLHRRVETQITNTPENELRPTINGSWVVYQEDSAGVLVNNIRIKNLARTGSIQMTNLDSEKNWPTLASGRIVWQQGRGGAEQLYIANAPNLMPVADNRNFVVVTSGLADGLVDAEALLSAWNAGSSAPSITRYTAFSPTPTTETLLWQAGIPTGTNFGLADTEFVWVEFEEGNVLDLGRATCSPIDLEAGANVVSYACFPDHYTAFGLVAELGPQNVRGIRMLDVYTGRWQAASVTKGVLSGEDFAIPRIAVVMIDMQTEISQWTPGE